MLYTHKRTGVLYRKIIESFSVERQEHSVVYMSLANGQVFDRGAKAFAENFVLEHDPQAHITPK